MDRVENWAALLATIAVALFFLTLVWIICGRTESRALKLEFREPDEADLGVSRNGRAYPDEPGE